MRTAFLKYSDRILVEGFRKHFLRIYGPKCLPTFEVDWPCSFVPLETTINSRTMEPLKRPRIVCKFNQKKLEVGDEYQCNKTIKTISSTILNPGVFTLLDLGPPPRPLLRELNDSRTSHSQDSQSLKTNAILVMDSEGERGWVDHEQFFIHDDPSPLEHLLGYDKSSKAVKKKWMTENQLVAAREEAKEGKGMFISDAALGSWDLTPHPTSTTSRQPRVRVEDRRSGQVESEIAGIPFAESSKKKVRLHAEESLGEFYDISQLKRDPSDRKYAD